MSDKDRSMSIPKFDGDYEHWAMLMENLLRTKEWWELIENGVTQPERNVILTGVQRTEIAEQKLKDLKVKNYLFASIDKNILKTIVKKESSKDIWESMKTKYQGNKRVQSAQLQRLRRNFEVLEMKEGDSITEYFSCVMMVANDMRNLGENMQDDKIVEKILRTLVEKFTYVVCAIEESKDIKMLSVDELQSSLLVHEHNLSKHDTEERVLKMEGGRARGGYSQARGRGGYRGGKGGRGGSSFDKSSVECYKCHKFGHFKNECPMWERTANYAEMEEDVLLMAQVDKVTEQVWYLDSGCSKHICGNKEWFVDFNGNFRQQVKLGDDRRMQVEGKGNLRLEIDGIIQVISSVYFVPGLRNNLLSVGQLQQKGLKIVIEDNECKIWHKLQRRLIIHLTMSKNRMFIISATMRESRDGLEANQVHCPEEAVDEKWHRRFGHLNHNSLVTLAEKEMVNGLPKLNNSGAVCEVCMKGKQNQANIPKRSVWRSSKCLELIHSDICGPISPTSESGKRYIINFIDDFSRKCWTFFLVEKSEALKVFKEFKVAAEREVGELLVCLRTDRGGEFNSKAFQDFCVENGIKRQLTTAYTPQQNSVAERKNRSLMNMVRCMMLGMNVPLKFWTEATQYAVHILNLSQPAILGEVTPSEKWCKHKLSVEHLRVFGCVAYALIPDERRTKLEEKSIKCVLFGVSKESKGYRFYDPVSKRIIISKDVQFDEAKAWPWEERSEDSVLLEDTSDEKQVNEVADRDVAEEDQRGSEEEVDNVGEQREVVIDSGTAEEIDPQMGEAQATVNGNIAGRSVQKPVWMKDYVCEGLSMIIEEEGDELMAMFVAGGDPETFEEAILHETWRNAMEAEISSIEENNTWELVDLPEGTKVIGVKWIFKTKFNEK